MLRNWPLSRTSYDVSATDLSVTPRTVADPALQLEPHHPIDFGTTDGIRVSPFDGVGTFGDFTGTGGKNHLIGTADDDTFDVSQGGNDTVEGLGGDDNVYFGASLTAKDKVYGGANNSYEVSNGDTVELEGDYSGGLTIGASTLTDIELVWLYGASFGNGGGSYAVKLNGASVAAGGYMQWIGFQSSTGTDHFDINGSAETDGDLSLQTYGRGADHLTGGGGNDFINGGVSGDDVLNGGGGWNRVSFSRAVTGASGGVTVSLAKQGHAQDVGGGRMVTLKNFQGLSGSARDDILLGDKNANYLSTISGNDTVHGAKGDDTIAIGGYASGTLTYTVTATGDAGNDTVFFITVRGGVTFSLDLQGAAQSVGADGVVNASGFENAAGTNNFGDVLTGNAAANGLYGDAGNDTLIGGGGNDSLYGDKAFGLLATDVAVVGASGTGSFDRGTGDDVLRGGTGDDLLSGGAGSDTADYSDAAGGGVVVDLNVLTAQAVGGGLGSDTLSSIENLIGSGFADTLMGDANANALAGGTGNDTMLGGDGDDVIDAADGDDGVDGGLGNDAVFGGSGNDTVIGHSGRDELRGGSGGDTLNGGDGDDFLIGDVPEQLMAASYEIVSTSDTGTPGDDFSWRAHLSPDGTKMVFLSKAGNFDGEPFSSFDYSVFVKDLVTGVATRVTGGADQPELQDSSSPSFSPDGTHIVFSSGYDFFQQGIYTYEIATGDLELVSTSDTGEIANGASRTPIFTPDGNVIFQSDASNLDGPDGIFLKDLSTGDVTLLMPHDHNPGLSADGTKLLFYSHETNLVAGDTNGAADLFVKDLTTGTYTLVSAASDGTQASNDTYTGVISPDGTKVVFESTGGLVPGSSTPGLLMKDLLTGELTALISNTHGWDASARFSPDGTKVAFSTPDAITADDDDSGAWDVYVFDLVTDAISCITVGPSFGEFDDVASFEFTPDGHGMLITASSSGLPGSNGEGQVYLVPLTFEPDNGVSDTLNGGTGDDILVGGGGADTMNGAQGKDVFRYGALSDSTGVTFDTIVGFDAQKDSIGVGSIGAIDTAINAGSLSDASFDTDLTAAVDAAHLGAHHAVLFTANAGGHAGQTFLVIDANNDAGYQSGEDFVIRLQGATNMGSFGVDNFI